MVYLAGDNNLSANSVAIMQELEAASHRDDVRVLACYDSNAPMPKGARYLEINHHRYTSSGPMNWGLHNDMVYPGHMVVSPDLCNDDPATIDNVYEPTAREGLSRFLGWALKKHPADRYMLILFGHGVLVAGNTFLGDTNPPSFLRLKDFTRIMKRHFSKHKLDLLALDNCVMNGIETAYEIRKYVDFMIGSQGLMLAVGWPFRKIINVVQRHPTAHTKTIARRILKACARNLLDFSLMERSSEQAVVDLRKLRNDCLTNAVKCLAEALKDGLKTDDYGNVCYPEIRDAVRLARLEAQSYWDETFVDLYDFCELLLKRSKQFVVEQVPSLIQFEQRFYQMHGDARLSDSGSGGEDPAIAAKNWLLNETAPGRHYLRIADCCEAVLTQFRPKKPVKPEDQGIVPYSYYVCPELQYSHGLSIYFPWTMPESPIIFERKSGSWPYPDELEDYTLKTAFDEYKGCDFAGYDGANWASFLIQFFKATLRNVRLVDYEYERSPEALSIYRGIPIVEPPAPTLGLQKTSSDTGEQDDCSGAKIKNYPRRFYLSPSDCKHRCQPYNLARETNDELVKCDREFVETTDEVYGRHCVSYLGWSLRGLVAEVVGLPPLADHDEYPEHYDRPEGDFES
jgi:hypothetical protein